MKPLFFICFLAVTALLPALDPGIAITNYNVKIWDIAGGLPGNAVFAIRQTSDGYLWIGTQDGLVRFDGVHFEVFTRETVPQLKSNDIRALYEDHSGVLWIGTSTGGLTRFKDGEFFTYSAAENNALARIKALAEDRLDNLWIGSYAGGLTCLVNGQFTTYTGENGLPDNQVRSIHQDDNRDLWVTTSTAIIKILKPGVFETYASQDILPYLKTAALYEARTGSLWVGTGEGGLFCLKNSSVSAWSDGAGVSLPSSSTINTLYKDRGENTWIGTDGGGLLRLNKDDRLACGSVYAITEDREGNLWVGTLDRGLYQLRDSKFITYTVGDGLSHNIVRCIYEDRENVTWIGTDGGLNRIKNGKPSVVLTVKEGLLNNTISCLSEDAAGNLWIGTLGGLHRFNGGKLTSFTVKNGLSDDRVKRIFHDKQGNTWIGTENGLNRYDPLTGKFEIYNTGQGLSGNTVEVIHEDSRGQLWIGVNNGLNRLSGGMISAYQIPFGEENYSVQCVYEDKEGTLWLGTDRGLIRLQGEVFERLTENDIFTILGDDRGYLWMGGRKGISRVALKELTEFVPGKSLLVNIETFGETDGLKSPWVIGVGCRTHDGRLWFATTMGAAVVDPGGIKVDKITLTPVIEKFIADGEIINIKSFSGGAGGRFFKKASLPPGKKRLDIHYTTVSFINPQGIRFRVKLEGYDDDWIEVGGQRNAVYNKLAPGHYTFKVTACGQDGIWSGEAAAFSFYLRPYFYQTAWFYIMAVFLILAAAFSFYQIRVGRLKAREKELNELVKSRTVELEEQSVKLKEMDKIKSRFFANISHEFRTPLTLILGPLEQMLTGPREGEKTQKKKMQLMLRNSRRLQGLINQLLELSRFDSGAVKLQVVRQNIVPFLKGVLHSFDSLACQKELELEFQTQAEDIMLYYDPVRLEEVFSNLLSNAIKFTPAGGKITLAVQVKKDLSGMENTQAQDFLEVLVSDTGPGIPREALAHIFDRFYQADSTYEYHRQGTGIGLAIAREIVELHHGTITAYSGGERPGTLFVISLPMGPAARGTQEGRSGHIESHLIAAPNSPGTSSHSQTSSYLNRHPAPRGLLVEGINSIDDAEEFAPGEKEEEIEFVKGPEALDRNIILVIEDSADVREYIRGALEPQYIVKEAKDGGEGLRMAGEIVPDLIICDIMMPGKDGFEVCREIKSNRVTSHIPVIILTAKAGEENILTGFETGADDYITKPFSTRILSARIKNLIELRCQLQQTLKQEMEIQPAKMSISKLDREFLGELQAIIEKNLSEPEFNVEELRKKLYMSGATLYRKVLALTNETPTDFIRSYRLKRAAQLLKNGSTSITEVAFEVGFNSRTYFSKCFKEKFNRLPSEYQERKENLNDE